MKIRTELNFPGELKDEAIICSLCKTFNIVMNIIEASFSTEVGWAILTFEGTPEELKKTLNYLTGKGVEVKDTQEIK